MDTTRVLQEAFDAAIAQLTQRHSHFDELAVVRYAADAATGRGVRGQEVVDHVAQQLRQTHDIEYVGTLRGRRRYSTPGVLKQEGKLLETAEKMASGTSHRISFAKLAARVSLETAAATRRWLTRNTDPTLSVEQREAIEFLAAQSGRLAVLAANPGTRKNETIARLGEFCQAAGYDVLAAAPGGACHCPFCRRNQSAGHHIEDSVELRGPRPPGGNGGPPKPPPPRPARGMLGWVLIVALGIMLLFMLRGGMNSGNEISITEFWTHIHNGDVKEVTIKEDMITGEFLRVPANAETDSKAFKCTYLSAAQKIEEIRKEIQDQSPNEVVVKSQPSNSLLLNLLMATIPWLLLAALVWFLLFRQLRQSGAGPGMLGSFGRSRHRMTTKEHTTVTFGDVAGIDESKEEVLEIVEFLKNPKRFQRLGGRIPRGVLLIGEPGCGKTLLAKAIAGEAEVPFFSISGSDFVEMFVGVGASRVRDLFRQAKENSPCIIFLDEIDAVGRRRGVGFNGGGHDEREQTLNAILVEMDGFDTNDQVIVIAATNRADVLDPALVRPGRFDRQVFVPLPDVKGRFEILKVHSRKIKLEAPIDPKLQRLARATPMFSGADLAAIINESALLATLAGKDAVDLEDLEEARDKVRWGRAKRGRVADEQDRKLTAYHEAGHALVQCLLPAADPLHKVSIIPRGPYGGATFALPEKDRHYYNRSWAEAQMRIACAGRIAEQLLGKDENSGVTGDIRQITTLARNMVTEWGMSDRLGFIHYGDDERARMMDIPGNRMFSDKTAELIDEEIKRIVDEAFTDTRRILQDNLDKLENIAQALLKYETLDGDEVRKIVAGGTIDRPTVSDLIAAEQDRRTHTPPVARPVKSPPPDEEPGSLPSPA